MTSSSSTWMKDHSVVLPGTLDGCKVYKIHDVYDYFFMRCPRALVTGGFTISYGKGQHAALSTSTDSE